MKTDHPNAKMAMDAMRADALPERMIDLVADDVVWHEVDNPEALHGKDELRRAITGAAERVTFEFEPYDVLGDDELVIAYGRAHLSAGDRSTTYDAVEIHRMRDGRIAERWAMVGDRQAMHEFWDGL